MTYTLRQELEAVITGAVAEIESIVRRRILGDLTGEPAAPEPVLQLVAAPAPRPVAKRAPKPPARPKHCVEPDCSKPSKGPRFGYRCEDHREAWLAGRTVAAKATRKRRRK